MPAASSDNLGGHRARYEHFLRTASPEEVGPRYVGRGDPFEVGYVELDVIRTFVSLDGLTVADVGCGIGRLTRHLVDEPVGGYLGLDIIPEILSAAEKLAGDDERFTFAIAEECRIPAQDESLDLVVGFSILTHLMDEEVFEYLQESFRALKPGALCLFSFLDLELPPHQDMFFRFAAEHRHGLGDIMKFTTKRSLEIFARRVGFGQVQFVDGTTDLKRSGLPSKFLDVAALTPTFQFGQSLCVLGKAE